MDFNIDKKIIGRYIDLLSDEVYKSQYLLVINEDLEKRIIELQNKIDRYIEEYGVIEEDNQGEEFVDDRKNN